jgi:hypothetical protein
MNAHIGSDLIYRSRTSYIELITYYADDKSLHKFVTLTGMVILLAFSFVSLILLQYYPSQHQAYASVQQQSSPSPSNISIVASFDATKGQLPEGLAIDNDRKVYVGMAPTSEVVIVNKTTGAITNYGNGPEIPPNKGFMTGLAFDNQDNLYAAVISLGPELQAGIYRIPQGGGNGSLFATHQEMMSPNDIILDKKGQQLFVSDVAGSIFKVQLRNATVTKWISDPSLRGDSDFCPPPMLPLDVGANGIALDRNETSLYVANTDHASILRIPIMTNGSAGSPEVIVGPDCTNLNGADGIAIDDKNDNDSNNDNIIVTVNKLNKIAQVSLVNRSITILDSNGILDFPASIETDTDERGQQTLYITNFAFLSSQQNNTKPNPALLNAQLGR